MTLRIIQRCLPLIRFFSSNPKCMSVATRILKFSGSSKDNDLEDIILNQNIGYRDTQKNYNVYKITST